MKIFISWSGQISGKVALELRKWIPTVLPFIKTYVSSEDTIKGERWLARISKELDVTSYGILCVVPGNARSPWLNFEAGALSKSLEHSRVSPFLVGVSPSDLPSTIAQFQCTIYDHDDVRKLVASLKILR